MRTLSEIHRALRTRVATDDAMKLVTTRLFLRTGVNLRDIPPTSESDQAAVTKVLEALAAFGHRLA